MMQSWSIIGIHIIQLSIIAQIFIFVYYIAIIRITVQFE